MANQGERADDFSQWTITALAYHIRVGEEALDKAEAEGDEDRTEVIQRVLHAQKAALGLKKKKKKKRDSIMDIIEHEFGNTRPDDRPERPEGDARRRPEARREGRQARFRVEDDGADVDKARQEGDDTPPSLEKRPGGGYHRRPAARFAREELRPRRAPRSSARGGTERDPFENFPLAIRPIFHTSYRPSPGGTW